jgi:16S rRNA (guanine1207-N2)-methyltransferase
MRVGPISGVPDIDGVYGFPPFDLARVPAGAVQLSPRVPGSARCEDWAEGSFASIVLQGPPGVLERRFALARALRLLRPGGRLVALAAKDRGGGRIAGELAEFGCAVTESSRRHHRICQTQRPGSPVGLEAAIAAGGPQMPPALGLWTQPGIFSWDRIDAGTALLRRHLPPLAGAGADFGCGFGALALAVLESPAVARLELVDIDGRAIAAARRNVTDSRASFAWRDLRQPPEAPAAALDFVVMNPPFHEGGGEDRSLGESFIRAAAQRLKPHGVCWLVANRHLPYEAALRAAFPATRLVEQAEGYKIYEARR